MIGKMGVIKIAKLIALMNVIDLNEFIEIHQFPILRNIKKDVVQRELLAHKRHAKMQHAFMKTYIYNQNNAKRSIMQISDTSRPDGYQICNFGFFDNIWLNE